MIRAIIFDCFGVLTADTWKEFVASLPEGQREQAAALNHAYDAGVIDKSQFLNEVQDLTCRQPVYLENLLDNETTKNEALLAYIRLLRPKYKIGMISNIATNWVRDTFLSGAEQQLFDGMVFSFEVGTTKPDAHIYETAAEQLGVPLDECVFIDDVERYCTAAAALGMRAICYQSFVQMKSELEALLADTED